jgi:imidazolonepropionase-like amidohydrolase
MPTRLSASLPDVFTAQWDGAGPDHRSQGRERPQLAISKLLETTSPREDSFVSKSPLRHRAISRGALIIANALLMIVTCSQYGIASGAPITAYKNGKWWNGDVFEIKTRYVENGVFTKKPVGPPESTVDLRGGFVVPPFADAHNHMAGSPSDVNARAKAAGVFYLMNPNVLASSASEIRAALSAPSDVDAVLAMGGITAPGGHPEKLYVDTLSKYVYPNMKPGDFVGDAFHYVAQTWDIDPVLDRLVSQHAQFVKIFLLFSEEFDRRKSDPAYRGEKGLDPKLVAAIVRAAHKRGLRVAAHIETAADFRVIVAAGVDEAAHMPGYFASTGPMSAYEITFADAQAAAKAHIVVVATASYATYGDQSRLPMVQSMQRANLRKLQAAQVPLLIGTDGSPDAAITEARYLIDLGIFTPKQALNSLALDTPRYILPGRKLGAFGLGYEASFLALGGDPTVDFGAVTHIRLRVKRGIEIASLAITHVAVVSMVVEQMALDQTILIAGNHIIDIGHDLPLPAGTEVIDGSGHFAIPGLWDMHVHVLNEGGDRAAPEMLSAMLRNGIVGVRDMGSTIDDLKRFRSAEDMSSAPSPEVVAAGPVVNGPATPWSRKLEIHVDNPEAADATVEQLAANGSQFIKVYSGLDAPTYAAVVGAAQRRGLVAGGHLPFAVDLHMAINVGQRSIEHMEVNISKSCGKIAPGAAAHLWVEALIKGVGPRDEAELLLRKGRDMGRCQALFHRMATRPIWWTPTLVLDFRDRSFLDAEFRRFSTAEDIASCETYAGALEETPATLRQRALQAELDDVAEMHTAGVHLLAGTDLTFPCDAPVVGLWRELSLFVRAGLSPYQALQTATVEPAAYFGRKNSGTLKPGNAADIVLIDANPFDNIEAIRHVSVVIKAGQVVDLGVSSP